MKKSALFMLSILALFLLSSCKTEEQTHMQPKNQETVTIINEVKEADIWILPQTEKNLKTTVWGTATASKVKADESRQASLCEPGDNGQYIFRMIVAYSFYYSANGIVLKNGWTIKVSGSVDSFAIAVSDDNGILVNSYEVFAARL